MDERERFLFENTLDAHDRLWDSKSSVIDVWALYAATAEALSATPHRAAFDTAVATLADLMRSEMSADDQRLHACGSTDDLRQYIVRQLGWAGTGGAASA